MKNREITLDEIRDIVGVDYAGVNLTITGLNLCDRKSDYNSILSYIGHPAFIEHAISNNSVKCLFLTGETDAALSRATDRKICRFIVANPEAAFYKLHNYLYEKTDFYDKYDFESTIGTGCIIHESAVIERGVIIGNNTVVSPNAVIRRGSVIGDNCHIGCCSVIGSEGFQAVRDEDGMHYIAKHAGRCMLGDNIHVGDNTTIGNSLFEGSVTIGNNTVIDNHSYIAHNCTVGENSVITAGVLVMGSAAIKTDTWLAPNSVIGNKITVHNKGFVGSMSLALKDVPEGTRVLGIPAVIK